MKRYVTEFANDITRLINYPVEAKKRIQNIVGLYERGMITSFEAVREIVKIHDNIF